MPAEAHVVLDSYFLRQNTQRSTPAHVNVFGPAVAVIFDTSPKLPLELRRDKRSSLHSFLAGGANHEFNFVREEGFR